MPGGEPVVLGPFNGGLNNVHHAGSIEDNELQELINFEVETDGTLISRPPINEIENGSTASGATTGRLNMIASRNGRAFGTNSAGLWYYNEFVGWALIDNVDAINLNDGTEYKGHTYFVGSPTDASSFSGRYSLGGVWTTISSMPKGLAITLYKERLWIAGGNNDRLYFSSLPDAGTGLVTWPAINFIDIAPNDSEVLQDLKVVDDYLIIFKSGSTYVLGYDANVADAVLRRISKDIGAFKDHCVVQTQGFVFVYHAENLYELSDFQYFKLNDKCDFEYTLASPVSSNDYHYIFALGDRIILRTDEQMYSYHIITRVWSEFESSDSILNDVGYMVPYYPEFQANEHAIEYCMGPGRSAVATGVRMFKWFNQIEGSTRERTGVSVFTNHDIECSMRTKNFNFGIFHTFKRLFWWGIELFTSTATTGQATVSAVGYDSQATNLITTSNRRFLKCKGALRFRLANFKVELNATGPEYVRIFNIVPIMKAPKQTVYKQITV